MLFSIAEIFVLIFLTVTYAIAMSILLRDASDCFSYHLQSSLRHSHDSYSFNSFRRAYQIATVLCEHHLQSGTKIAAQLWTNSPEYGIVVARLGSKRGRPFVYIQLLVRFNSEVSGTRGFHD